MDQRNLILAIVFSVAILLGYQMFIEQPQLEQQRAEQEAAKTAGESAAPGQAGQPSAPAVPSVPGAPKSGAGAPPPATGSATPPSAAGIKAPATAPRSTAIAASPRVAIDSERVEGSLALRGGRIDDVTLREYHETVDPNSPRITLLSPQGSAKPYFADFGWVAAGNAVKVPDANTLWTADRKTLTPDAPVTLSWDNGAGLTFKRTISLDRHYMFTVHQSVENRTSGPVTLYPYALVSRFGTPKTLGFFVLHEGPLGVFNGTLKELDYDDLVDDRAIEQRTTGGWIGMTDKYWLAALVPNQKMSVNTRFTHHLEGKTNVYQVDYLGTGVTVAPGNNAESTGRLFAGAKVVRLLENYQDKEGIVRFDLAIDFGWFYFLTKPIFYILEYFYRLIGNFGLAILLLTVLIKAAFFPLANKSYRAMNRLKQLQPKMMEIRDRYKDDRAKQNQEMMELYKREKANPMSGCLPMLIQIPVFFALYKVLFVNIEMRHAPFYGWIQDLSAPDPTSVFTLFGAIPWSPPEFLMIGIWPLIMGLTMFLQQKLNPAPPDPVQARIFMLLPIIFTFMLARFPAGLVIYWAWNNTLSIAQQWIIMRRMGVTRKT